MTMIRVRETRYGIGKLLSEKCGRVILRGKALVTTSYAEVKLCRLPNTNNQKDIVHIMLITPMICRLVVQALTELM